MIPVQRTRGNDVSGQEGAFYLWIDGVGGYLVCLSQRITLGQAAPDATVDVPLLADVSRLHAALTRDPEGYVLHAARPARVNGKAADKALLRTGDRFTLGPSCQLLFRQPAPISTSARLDVVSGHRLRPAVDAVLLMADTIILGPGQNVHVELPDVKQPVILFRQKTGLGIRAGETVSIDGHCVKGRGELTLGAHVVGDDFSLAIERAVP
jgi:hypothetical protein